MSASLVGSEMCIRDSTLLPLSLSLFTVAGSAAVQLPSTPLGAMHCRGQVPAAINYGDLSFPWLRQHRFGSGVAKPRQMRMA
eukprot:10000754-Alexandrium_andersonii.AAC.1